MHWQAKIYLDGASIIIIWSAALMGHRWVSTGKKIVYGMKTNNARVYDHRRPIEKHVQSPLLGSSSIENIMEIDRHLGCTMSGLTAESRLPHHD